MRLIRPGLGVKNLPGPLALKRMMAAMVELFCDSFATVPRRLVLDIDDTEDRVHGAQQLSLFHAHYHGRCFLPMHIYEAATGKPVAVILPPARRRTVPRWRWCCITSCGPSAPAGRALISWSAATAITAATRR